MRRRIAADLVAAGVPEEVVEDVVLVATALLSNALRHAHPLPENDLIVTWQFDGQNVRIEVTDGGGDRHPHVRHPAPNETSGRGLSIVGSLAADWGVQERSDSTSVWATLRA